MSSRRRSVTSSVWFAALEQRLPFAGLHEQAFGVRLLGAGAGGVGEGVPGQEDLRPGVAEVKGDLALLQQAVHRHDGRAGAQRAVVADREVRDVGQHEPDAVARLDALGAQQRSRARGRDVERGVGQFALVELDRHAVGVFGGAAAEEVGKVRHHMSNPPLTPQTWPVM